MSGDLDELWLAFASDAEAAFTEIEETLLALEQTPDARDEIARLYRALHTIKGNTGFVRLTQVERLAHAAEDLVSEFREGSATLGADGVDILLATMDALRAATTEALQHRRDVAPGSLDHARDLVRGFHTALVGAKASGPAETLHLFEASSVDAEFLLVAISMSWPRLMVAWRAGAAADGDVGAANVEELAEVAERSSRTALACHLRAAAAAWARVDTSDAPELERQVADEVLRIEDEFRAAHGDAAELASVLPSTTDRVALAAALRGQAPGAEERAALALRLERLALHLTPDVPSLDAARIEHALARGADGPLLEALTRLAAGDRAPTPEAPASRPASVVQAPAPRPAPPAQAHADEPAVAAPAPKAEEPAARREAKGGEQNAAELLRIDARKIAAVMDLAGEIGLAVGAVTRHPELAGLDLVGFSSAAHKLESLVRDLQTEVSAMRLVPVDGLFQRMQRVVRDAGRRTGKDVALVVQGEDTEIDRLALDALQAPLTHALRNAVDHGLEPPEARAAAGKAPRGRVTLSAAHVGGEVAIEIADDGRGLDRERILARARSRGLVPEGVELEPEAIDALIFLPGFSTKDTVDELSGRGVGMDVVKTTVEAMRGRIALRSRPGRGTTLTITLPLTLAFIDAMVVRDGARLFALPTERVIEVLQKTPERMASTAHGEHALVRVRERHVPLLSLPRFYGEPGGALDVEDGRLLVVVQGRAGSVAIPVDAVLGHQQIMLKPLGGLMQKIRGATGYGMLRTGDVALTLDCEQLTT